MALALKWDREFESAFLQRRVINEPHIAIKRIFRPGSGSRSRQCQRRRENASAGRSQGCLREIASRRSYTVRWPGNGMPTARSRGVQLPISCDAALELPELLGIGLSLRERADRSEPGELACHRFAAVEHLRCVALLICSARDGSRAQSQHVRSRGSQAPANRLRRISLRRVRGPQGRSQSAAHQSARLADIASP